MSCPMLYRFRVIDRLPEPPRPAAARGTLVHAVLERLFDLPATERTIEAARGPGAAGVGAGARRGAGAATCSPSTTARADGWFAAAAGAARRGSALEDPTRLEPAERELYVETELDDGLQLRGYVDRLDVAADGRDAGRRLQDRARRPPSCSRPRRSSR